MSRAGTPSRARRVALSLLASIVPALQPLHAQSTAAPAEPGFVPLSAAVRAPGLDVLVTLDFEGSLRAAVARIAAQANLAVAYDDALPGLDAPVVLHVRRVPAHRALARALDGSPLRALVSRSGQIVLARRPPREGGSAELRGVIRDALTNGPVVGARVDLVGTRFDAFTRDSGAFSVGGVPAGRYELRVLRLGYEPLATTIDLPDDLAGGALRLEMRRASLALSEIIVTPGYFGLLQPTLATPNALSRDRLETIPQIGEDIYRAVSRLPGVSADDFSAKFSVRGGSGDELYVSLDGLELVEPFHLKDLGGAFSIVDIQSLGTASLTTGGFSAEYGDRLTGVFTLATTDPRTDRARTSVGVSVMNARATAQGGFAKGRGGWLVSARPGYIDIALKLTDIRDSLRPRYYDVFAKAQYDLGRGGRVAMHVLRAADTFRYVDDNEPSISSRYGSDYAWLTWNADVGTRLHVVSVASVGALGWRREGEHPDSGFRTVVDDERSMHRVGVRQDWSLDVAPAFLLKWGVDLKRESATYDYFSAVRRGDPVRPDSLVADTTSITARPATNRLGAYLAPRVRLLRSLTAELGVRIDRNSHLDESMVDPRLNLTWEPRAGTTVRGAWGRYSQSQQLFSLDAADGIERFARAAHAEQRILGIEQGLPRGITARVEAYERTTRNARPTFVNASGDILLFPEISWDRLRVDRTESRDRGLEVQASRANAGRADWSVSYSLASATDLVGGRWVARSLDERHAVHADWSIRPRSNSWRLSVGGVWHSGWPYTPTVLVVDTLENTPTTFSLRSRSVPGALNSERLRSYRRLDARWTRYFDTSRGRISIFGEVYNLLGTENQRGVWKEVRVRGRRVQVDSEEITQWPRLPLAGFSWEF